jgi:hypothetical protein
VSRREEKTVQSERKQVVGREDRGQKISKEDGSWKTQQAEKAIVGFFRAPHEKEGKTGWRSPKNMGQVDLGF